MSRKPTGWQCQKCETTFATRRAADACCPSFPVWQCARAEPHLHEDEKSADYCTAVCVGCGHSWIRHQFPSFRGCMARFGVRSLRYCACNEFSDAAEGGAE